jgi:hypothetical protein
MLTENRKRKFRRWSNLGVPKGAPLREKLAFGAFTTNRQRRAVSGTSVKFKDAQSWDSKVNEGEFLEIDLGLPLKAAREKRFRGKLARIASEFQRKFKGTGFVRLQFLARGADGSKSVDIGDFEEPTENWLGSRHFKTLARAREVVGELCDKIADEFLENNPDGLILKAHIFVLRTKKHG